MPAQKCWSILIALMMMLAPMMAISPFSHDAAAGVASFGSGPAPSQAPAVIVGFHTFENAWMFQARLMIVDRLIELDVPPREAAQYASELNDDDLAVLSLHPDMMQRAGNSNQMNRTIIVAVIVVGIIVLIGVAGSGSLSIS